MVPYICVQCGVQYAPSPEPPARCDICEDERQYVNWRGQQWTTSEALQETYGNQVRQEEPGLFSVETTPPFAIQQRALLLQTGRGNVLWDCLSLIDLETVEAVEQLGGIAAMAIGHPHFQAAMIEWSEAFGDVPVYVHDADATWVQRPDSRITYWTGDTHLIADGVTLVRCGGHFEGSAVLHWSAGADGRGVLLTGDTLKVGQDRASVSVMRSFPNLIPLGPQAVRRVAEAVEPLAYDRIYGGWPDHQIDRNGRTVVAQSLKRYLDAIQPPA
jgi:glyoxylase-like metal-dependent hydrolase (beta-lactamase superfamily II)